MKNTTHALAALALALIVAAIVVTYTSFKHDDPTLAWPPPGSGEFSPIPPGQCPPSLIGDLKDPCKRAATVP